MLGRRKPSGIGDGPAPGPTPEEEAAYEAGIDRVAAEKRKALADPGPSWREWFLHENAKWWLGLTYFVVDSWIIAYWIEVGNVVPLLPSLVAAGYLEYLGYLYLWYRPSEEKLANRGRYRRTFWEPFEYGRWTPEAARARAGLPILPHQREGGPDPTEFL